MNGAELAVASLVEEGVKTVFGVPGTSEIPLVNELARSSIEYMLCLHESVAVGMADGFSRAAPDGRLAIANTHATQGTLNGVGLIRASLRDRVPTVVLAGTPGTGYTLNEPNHQLNGLVDMLSRVTKWTWRVESAAQIGQAVHRGLTLARTGAPGPVAILIPQDFLEGDTEQVPVPRVWDRIVQAGRPTAETVDRLRNLVAAASRPIVIAGGSACRDKAFDALVAFSQALSIPVVTESVDRGPTLLGSPFPTTHPHHVGFFSRHDADMAAMLRASDLLILIGTRASYPRVLGDWISSARVLQIDSFAWEMGKNHGVELGVVGDIAEILLAVIDDEASPFRSTGCPLSRDRVEREMDRGDAERSGELAPEPLARYVAAKISDGDVLVDDSQSLGAYLKRYLRFSRPGRLYGSLASHLGWGIPAALGVQVARPAERVICVVSDGSFLLAPQGLWTAARYALPVTFLVVNNGGFVSLRNEMTAAGRSDEHLLTSLGLGREQVDHTAVARGLGVSAMSVRTMAELDAAFERRAKLDGPLFIDVRTPKDADQWVDGWFTPGPETL